jgi:LAS superfamily LD-carboxypeptidase LdcB
MTIPIYASAFLYILQKQENETLNQKLLTTQQILRYAEEKRENMQEKIYLLGKFDPSQRDDFMIVPEEYSVSGYTMYLRKETLSAFLQMEDAAEKDGIDLKIASATRNFDYQKNLWNNKWNALPEAMDGLIKFQTILEYSAVPGTSRHHWGTDIDINGASPEYFETEKGEEVYEWLNQNAASFGFCQTYTAKGPERPNGYNEEKWHWSYLPLSQKFTEDYKNLITNKDITGFDGDEYTTEEKDLIDNYVLGINPQCL